MNVRLRLFGLTAFVLAACGGDPSSGFDDDSDDDGTSSSSGTVGIEPGTSSSSGGPGSSSSGGGPGVCGNGIVDPGEVCDDRNTTDGDGCSADCLTVDPNFDCSAEGVACVRVVICGNGAIEGQEVCDPGTQTGGCAADCMSIEAGWVCPRPGKPCIEVPECLNGILELGEQCDSGAISDPGCIDCQVQTGFFCAVPGQACASTGCGSGFLTPGKQCDDGNLVNGDGCSNTCQIETGWRCNIDGCRPICGDGLLRIGEACDDGNTASGDGCSASCRVEPGRACPTPGVLCGLASCGNGVEESGEGCDDNNTTSGDGCSSTCQDEPEVTPGASPVVNVFCGDGLLTGVEECDDGNATSGDGCSDTCEEEDGFLCTTRIERPAQVRFKVTYRDFLQRSQAGGHPHMRVSGVAPPAQGTDRQIPGVVCNSANGATCGRLDTDGKPQLRASITSGNIQAQHPSLHDNPAAFSLWFRDTNPAPAIVGTNGAIQIQPLSAVTDYLTLNRQGGADSTVYSYDSSNFFPLDSRGHGNTPGQSHNFHFTTELRYFFQYQGGETLSFRGDDDVFVFINGRLAVDIGGIHGPQWGRVVLGDDGEPSGVDSNCTAATLTDAEPPLCALSAEEIASPLDTRFGLTKGGVYEIALFHAERHPTGSNFRLTLSGFLAPRSFCEPICGDGLTVGTELCDDGANNADDVYGVCNTTCSGRDICGDGVAQSPPEACDNGFNSQVWSSVPGGCAPGCMLPKTCGDGTLQEGFELCDYGAANNDTTYEGCTTSCRWGPFCGDGSVQAPQESCDDGFGANGNVSYAPAAGRCGFDCAPAPYCGDAQRNGPEQCDLGTAQNTGAYGACNANCTLAPRCGDRVVQSAAGEQCDDGATGSARCTADCKRRGEVN